MLVNEFEGAVPTWANAPPVAPVARKMSYPVTPTLSLDAAQDRNTDEGFGTLAVGVPGTVGAWVSTGGGGVVVTGPAAMARS